MLAGFGVAHVKSYGFEQTLFNVHPAALVQRTLMRPQSMKIIEQKLLNFWKTDWTSGFHLADDKTGGLVSHRFTLYAISTV